MIKIFTDGSCLGNPGKGGWAAIIISKGEKKILFGKKINTTNNQMELTAPIKALKKIPKGNKIEIFTDSNYLKMGITTWIKKWKKNGWKTSAKKDVMNKNLWIDLEKEPSKFDITWTWVKAHSNNDLNNEVDLLAKKAAI